MVNLEGKSTQLYVQVFEDLLAKIKTGYYSPGDQLPTELAMESIYGVSRAPIKQALGKLGNAGLITRKAGKGTFVTDWKPGKYPLLQMGGFESHYIYNREYIHCKTLTVETIPANLKVAAALKIMSDSPVIHASRLRYVRDEAVFYLNHYLIPDVGIEKIKAAGDFVSLPDILASNCNFENFHVSEEVTASKAEPPVARMLGLSEGDPVMFIKRFAYTREYQPIYYTEYYVKAGAWTYRVNFSRKQAPTTEKGE